MARYYMHQRGGRRDFSDEEGEELESLEAARVSAVAGIRSILASEILDGFLQLHERIDIQDEAGRCLLSIRFDEAVELSL